MKLRPKIALIDHFANLTDPRIDRTKEHKLIDILTIAICAVICGADTWIGIETYGRAKYQWLEQFLELPNGIPSHDTFARVFARLDPEEFQKCFFNWVKSISQLLPGEVISIDGKTLRHSYDTSNNKAVLYLVSAWASSQRLVLGQKKVDEKSNEITAIPELIKVLELSGCLVTIDAMGTQKEIAKLIIEQGADYCLALKGNQGNIHEDREIRYYLNSFPSESKLFAHAVRSHWQIENCLHWILDIGFREDHSRIRRDNAPENFA